MRALVTLALVALSTSATPAADKDADKAKEVTQAFLKALKAKDIDALMKTVDVPFVTDHGTDASKTIDKTAELKTAMTKFVESAVPEKVAALEVGTVYDMGAFAKFAKDKGAEEVAERAEKLVGKTGYMVMLSGKDGKERSGVLVRIKDGKASIAGIPK
jgi:hypothetical protein